MRSGSWIQTTGPNKRVVDQGNRPLIYRNKNILQVHCFGKRPLIYSVVDGLSKFPWKRCGK